MTRRLVLALAIVAFATVGCSSNPKRATSVRSGVTSTSTSGGRADQALKAQTTGRPHTLDDAFFGFNGASIVQTVNVDLLLDPVLAKQLTTFPTRLLRVPTGTAAQWIDWRTGAFIPNATSPFASIPTDRRPVTMGAWARLVHDSGAEPVWDLNVLTSTLDDQLEMLTEAKRLGMPVRFIELGNELWDSRSIYPSVFPDGASYATKMNTWITVLRARFPDAKIAVCGADPSDEFFAKVFGERYRQWNAGLFATIRGADAVTFHPYWTLPERADPGSDVAATLSVGLDAWDRFREDTLADVPDGMDVWLTEWNQAAWGSKTGSQIWAQALSVVAVAMGQLSDDRITMSLIHDIVDGEPNPHDAGISITFPAFTDGASGSEPLAPTALGNALPLLFGAVPPGSTVTALGIDGVKRIGAHPGVQAVQVTGPEPGALFVNRTATPVVVRLPRTMTGTWQQITLSAQPTATPGWTQGAEPRHTKARITDTLTLPAYSLVRLGRY